MIENIVDTRISYSESIVFFFAEFTMFSNFWLQFRVLNYHTIKRSVNGSTDDDSLIWITLKTFCRIIQNSDIQMKTVKGYHIQGDFRITY